VIRYGVRFLWVALVIGWAATAAAGEEDPNAARGHFQAGQAYLARGELRRALAEFLSARRELDRPELDFNVARTYDRLGDAARALDFYHRYLERSPNADDRAAVDSRIAALEPLVGTLRIECEVPGALVTVDEDLNPTAIGQGVRMTAGRHRVTAAKDGYASRTVSVDVVGEREAHVKVDPVREVVVIKPKRRTWVWGIVAGGLVLVGGSIALGIALTTYKDSTLGTLPPMLVSF
jgi:hypothetical protein